MREQRIINSYFRNKGGKTETVSAHTKTINVKHNLSNSKQLAIRNGHAQELFFSLDQPIFDKIKNGDLFKHYNAVNKEKDVERAWRELGNYGDCGNFAIAVNNLLGNKGTLLAVMETIEREEYDSDTDTYEDFHYADHIILSYNGYLIDSNQIIPDTKENRDLFKLDALASMLHDDEAYSFWSDELDFEGFDINDLFDWEQENKKHYILPKIELLAHVNPEIRVVNEKEIRELVPMTFSPRIEELEQLLKLENTTNEIDHKNLHSDPKARGKIKWI